MNLKIESEDGFLHLQDLPHNCIFNKVITGCGGTTIALFNEENYVIAVPTIELIINKTNEDRPGLSKIEFQGKEQNVFGLFGQFSDFVESDLIKYIQDNQIKKILCTYDKLARLTTLINCSNFRLLVDEYHNLLKAYAYRKTAINGVLENYKQFKSACFMSATPINPDFKPKALENLDIVVADWDNTEKLKVTLIETNKPYVKAANIINSYKKNGYIEVNGYKSTEAFFFINCVTDIANILNHCNLNRNEVKIVCADTDANQKKLEGYDIETSIYPNKPFTFITSKSFEGADYFSNDGICFVLSNTHNPNTLEDISTDIIQIAGRIRTETNPFRNAIVHIFNTEGKRKLNLDKTYEEIVNDTQTDLKATEELVNFANSLDENTREHLTKTFNKYYIYKDTDGKYKINDIIIKLELYEYNIQQYIYKTGLTLKKAYTDLGNTVTELKLEILDETIHSVSKRQSFKDLCLQYNQLLQNKFDFNQKEDFKKQNPYIVEAFEKLGFEKIRSLKYIKKNIAAALINIDKDKIIDDKVAAIIIKNITLDFHSRKELKEEIQRAYDFSGKKATAKATDITKWFDAREMCTTINKKSVRGFKLYRTRISFKD